MRKILLISLLLFILSSPIVFALDRVEINTASLEQLDTLTGIGQKYAQAIINARPFSSVDDLLRVKGIGPKTLQKIKDQGLAYVSGQVQQPTPAPESAPVPDSTSTPEPSPTVAPNTATNSPTENATPIIYPSGIHINEILPNPAGADEENEWIEIYNSNNSNINLSGWQIQDKEGTITTFTIPNGTQILADGFLVFKRPQTNIMLNNDNDGLNLLSPDTKIADSINFTSAPLNQSYNKTTSGWRWSSTLTPGAINIIAGVSVPSKTTQTLSKAKNSVKNTVVAADLTGSQNFNTNQDYNNLTNPWFLFFTVLATTIILAVIVLLIKLKFAGANKA